MSSSQPPRRRRIAGERRRPSDAPSQEEPSRPAETAPAPSSEPEAPDPASDREPRPPGRPGPLSRLRRSRTEAHTGAVPTEQPTEEPTEESSPGRLSWWGSRQSIVALALALTIMVTLVALGAFGLLGNTGVPDVQRAEDTQVAAESAPSVAERAAEAILAYDHGNIDADQDSAQRFMTSSFAEEYATTFEQTVKPAARTYRAQVEAEVHGSSVVRAAQDRVRVLLFVDQTTRSTAHERPQVALNRVEFDMVLRDGEWLVDDISSY
jgi:Mce-associated membrane protein